MLLSSNTNSSDRSAVLSISSKCTGGTLSRCVAWRRPAGAAPSIEDRQCATICQSMATCSAESSRRSGTTSAWPMWPCSVQRRCAAPNCKTKAERQCKQSWQQNEQKYIQFNSIIQHSFISRKPTRRPTFVIIQTKQPLPPPATLHTTATITTITNIICCQTRLDRYL